MHYFFNNVLENLNKLKPNYEFNYNGKDVDRVNMAVGSLETMYSMAQKLQ